MYPLPRKGLGLIGRSPRDWHGPSKADLAVSWASRTEVSVSMISYKTLGHYIEPADIRVSGLERNDEYPNPHIILGILTVDTRDGPMPGEHAPEDYPFVMELFGTSMLVYHAEEYVPARWARLGELAVGTQFVIEPDYFISDTDLQSEKQLLLEKISDTEATVVVTGEPFLERIDTYLEVRVVEKEDVRV